MKKEHVEDRAFKLNLSIEITSGLLDAYDALYGHLARESRELVWRHLRKFAEFLTESGMASLNELPGSVIHRYYEWLASQPLAGSTKQSTLNNVKIVLQWCQRNRPSLYRTQLEYESRSFARQEPKTLPPLDRQSAEKIIEKCVDAASEIENRLVKGQASLSRSGDEPWPLVRMLLVMGDGFFPTDHDVTKAGKELLHRVREAGGLRYLWGCVYPKSYDLLPFYIAITFQTAGNPQAIAKISRDCIRTNPLREDREWVVWEKPRSTREQKSDFQKGAKRGAPSLIRTLLSMTEPLLPYAGEVANRLFICYSGLGVGSPSVGQWHYELKRFISQNSLPDFTFSQLRRTSAVLHHQAGGSILTAKRKLNHLSLSTTARYTTLGERGEQHERLIAKSQASLIVSIRADTERKNGKTSEGTCEDREANTVFGFVCRDPYSGYGGADGRDGPCDHFYRCASCPGAIIPLDRIDVVGRLLKAQTALIKARDRARIEGRLERFNALYEPTLVAIERDILPHVTEEMRRRAIEADAGGPLPELE
ncbi:hypothetical protein [Cupriavidus pauculus]|uniref:hypothetical protein n=1 Tax=Cupriavidus pauculus TaxID=82633 RepID=UPI000AAFC98B|nr:hypothetical protein [Cupriavidus pauculus]